MAAEQPTQIPSRPKMFQLAGKELLCYQAGEQMGVYKGCNATAQWTRQYGEHLRSQLTTLQAALLQHPTWPIPDDHPARAGVEALASLADPFIQAVADQGAQAQAAQSQASQIMGRVAQMETAKEERWKPPLRAWAMLAAMMVLSTTVATIAAIAFLR